MIVFLLLMNIFKTSLLGLFKTYSKLAQLVKEWEETKFSKRHVFSHFLISFVQTAPHSLLFHGLMAMLFWIVSAFRRL